jgi:hypothetical protein
MWPPLLAVPSCLSLLTLSPARPDERSINIHIVLIVALSGRLECTSHSARPSLVSSEAIKKTANASDNFLRCYISVSFVRATDRVYGASSNMGNATTCYL